MDRQAARSAISFWISLLAAALALGASAILLVDYIKPAPVFCAPDGGCGLLRQSAYAYPWGIPMPFIGLVGLLGIAISGALPGRRARQVHAALACTGALLGAALLSVQLSLHTFCPYCLVVDAASLVIAALAIARLFQRAPDTLSPVRLALAGLLLTAAMAAPLIFGMSRKPALPEVVAAELRKSPRGHATVVDFVDFECPYCRRAHAELAPLLEERRGRVRVARKQVPLSMHPHAFSAARAACCAERLGKADEVADALFAASPSELTAEGCERIAVSRGIDRAQFRACMADPATDARIHADAEAFRATHGRGLPTLWIGEQRLEGLQSKETLRRALDEAISAL